MTTEFLVWSGKCIFMGYISSGKLEIRRLFKIYFYGQNTYSGVERYQLTQCRKINRFIVTIGGTSAIFRFFYAYAQWIISSQIIKLIEHYVKFH